MRSGKSWPHDGGHRVSRGVVFFTRRRGGTRSRGGLPGRDAPGENSVLTRTTLKLNQRSAHDPPTGASTSEQLALFSAAPRPPRLRVKKRTFDGHRCWRRGRNPREPKWLFGELWEADARKAAVLGRRSVRNRLETGMNGRLKRDGNGKTLGVAMMKIESDPNFPSSSTVPVVAVAVPFRSTRSIAVSKEGCLCDGRFIANLRPTVAASRNARRTQKKRAPWARLANNDKSATTTARRWTPYPLSRLRDARAT